MSGRARASAQKAGALALAPGLLSGAQPMSESASFDPVPAPVRSAAAHPAAQFSEGSTTLSLGAGAAYEIFSDPLEVPRWLPMIQSARTLSREGCGRPRRVAFVRRLDRGSLGYTLEYRYAPAMWKVAWTTSERSSVVLRGDARFAPLSARACLMRYRLVLDLPIVGDPSRAIDHHPAALVIAEFREHLRRFC
jgi:hypothetical protein